ncbi:MAG: CRISPR-associated endonuclease Cas3'' [Desulfovibrio sp.]|jgi:CRISPR-associated endonuclease/helicase Cas3|nr:CRISPR-associated endonuclease Cas3'' [Desulfovibrio sp.]
MHYYAHSIKGQPEDKWQPLHTHLAETAALAGDFAEVFGNALWAKLFGLLHDLGKYSTPFQQRLAGSPIRVDHSLAGALEAIRLLGRHNVHEAVGRLAAHIISGHHTGLVDGLPSGNPGTALAERLVTPSIPDYSAWVSEIVLPEPPRLPDLRRPDTVEDMAFSLFFWAHMLFSCLVDADFLNTEAFLQPGKAALRNVYPRLEILRPILNNHLTEKIKNSKLGKVNTRRAEVLEACKRAALLEPGIFSLTVPTGGGKTLSSLAFALDHACRCKLRRIIYVIPYTSIIEQTAGVFREVLGPDLAHTILEHHSNIMESEPASPEYADSVDNMRSLAFENWDAPIVVTTAVQFFESLFAARSSRCRKLHNIAGSVVILDEAQTLPLPLLRPCLAAIKELVSTYRVSFVLCTATQPELGIKPWNRNGLENVREIVPDVESLFTDLERVDIEFIGAMAVEDLAERLIRDERVLCIVNTRKQAHELCQSLREKHASGLYHLSTWMCPDHRRVVLNRVKSLLKDPSCPPVRLIATSLIEAGVDIDFPVVYRAMAGQESIAQAAGRSNREGLFGRGKCYVFDLPHTVRGEQSCRQSACRAVVRAGLPLLSPSATKLYFDDLYALQGENALDAKKILRQVAETAKDGFFPFRSVSENFRFIEHDEVPVIVPYSDAAKTDLEALRAGRADRVLYRRLQQWIVTLPHRLSNILLAAGSIQPVNLAGQYYELVNLDLYSGMRGGVDGDVELGLNPADPTFREAEGLIT